MHKVEHVAVARDRLFYFEKSVPVVSNRESCTEESNENEGVRSLLR